MNTTTVTARAGARASTLLWGSSDRAGRVLRVRGGAQARRGALCGDDVRPDRSRTVAALPGRAAELAGAAGLLIPRLAGLAAAGLAADMADASIINAAVVHSAAVAMTVPLCAVFTLIAASRRAQIRNLAVAITRR
jgi:hypothetical protein